MSNQSLAYVYTNCNTNDTRMTLHPPALPSKQLFPWTSDFRRLSPIHPSETIRSFPSSWTFPSIARRDRRIPLAHESPIFVLRNSPLDRSSESQETTTIMATEKKSSKRAKGVYSRPSAAIERGSGFFIPGLEGSRVRILFGVLFLILSYCNSNYFQDMMTSSYQSSVVDVTITDASIATRALSISQGLTTTFAAILLLQGLVEFGKELGLGANSNDSISSSVTTNTNDKNIIPNQVNMDLQQYVATSLLDQDETVEAIRWAVASFIAMTPATHVLLLQTRKSSGSYQDENHTSAIARNTNVTARASILYSLGDFSTLSNDDGHDTEKEQGISAATNTVFEQSKGGRVSIPSSHPSSIALLPEGYQRCVLLQRIDLEPPNDDTRLCLLIGSNKLLPSYTKNDLKWLGRLAKLLALHLKPK